MPSFDLSHWSSTQFEERMELRARSSIYNLWPVCEVNGQSKLPDSSTILFTYSRQRTPIVTEVYPEA